MGITPDRFPGTSDEEELLLEDRTADGDPVLDGAIRYVNGDFRGKTATGVSSLTTGSGLSPATHRTLDQLIHEIAEDAYLEVVRTTGKVSSITYWTDSGKTIKIRETLITRDVGGKVSQTVETQYDVAGNPIAGEILTTALTRSAGKVVSMDMVRT